MHAGLESVPTGLCGGHGVGCVVGGQIRVPLEMADESEIGVPRSGSMLSS